MLLRACAAGIATAACLVPVAGARSDAGSEPSPALGAPSTVHTDDRLDTQLGNVAATARQQGAQAALRTARVNGLDTVSGRIRVVVEATPGDARDAVAARGGTVEATAGQLTEALVPPGSITAVSTARGVQQVRAPYAAFTLGIESEGIASVEADVWHTAGATGAGAKVAIIDLGFAGIAGRQAAGELPAGLTTVDYCGGSLGHPEVHGTAVAEIVHEMAPGAQLYAICVDSEVDLATASAYAKAHGITIVNHSVGWYNTARGDGTGAAGTPDAIVAAARTDGILWVNAAGNAGQEHWSGTFSDPDGNGHHNFSGSDEGNSIQLFPDEEVCGFLKWDAWPTTREDFDLHLIRDSIGALVTISADDQQNGPLAPTEALCYANPYNTLESFSFVIDRWSAATSPRFDFFVTIADALQYTNAAGSVVEPATSPSTLAVGAVAWWDNVLEPYSSVGPTIDGRVKPDLAAPSSVTSGTYGVFAGTSSAAPHVAGAAALLRAMFPLATPAELQAFLEEEAQDLGAAGMDSLFGAGVLLLPASQPLVTTFAPTADPTGTGTLAVSGSLSPRGMSTTYRWDYGTTTAYGSQTAAVALASPRADQEVGATLTGLTPNTDYHYRLVATNAFGTTLGADRTNRTGPPVAPLATTSASESVGSSQARLAGRVTPNGTASTAWFEWGTTTGYGNTTAPQSGGVLGETVIAAELTGLLAATQYHYRLIADNVYGQTEGADHTFTTTSGVPPFATTGTATALGTTGMTVYGDVTPGGLATTYQFDYRPVGSTVTPTRTPLTPANAGYGTGVQAVTATTTNVNPNFAYEYRLVATNSLGSHTGQFRSFTISPPAPPAPPVTPPSSGGGGGGGSGSLNLGVTLSAAKATLAPNETVEIRVTVTHKGGSLSATQLRALIGLPTDATLLGAPAVDRGSGCSGTAQLNCYLDFLAPAATTVVRFSINVGGVGGKVITARLLQLQTDTVASDSSSLSLARRSSAGDPDPASAGRQREHGSDEGAHRHESGQHAQRIRRAGCVARSRRERPAVRPGRRRSPLRRHRQRPAGRWAGSGHPRGRAGTGHARGTRQDSRRRALWGRAGHGRGRPARLGGARLRDRAPPLSFCGFVAIFSSSRCLRRLGSGLSCESSASFSSRPVSRPRARPRQSPMSIGSRSPATSASSATTPPTPAGRACGSPGARSESTPTSAACGA